MPIHAAIFSIRLTADARARTPVVLGSTPDDLFRLADSFAEFIHLYLERPNELLGPPRGSRSRGDSGHAEPTSTEPVSARPATPLVGLAAALLVAWLGMAVHHAADLPDLPPLAPEYTVPAALSAALFLLCWRAPSPTTRGLLLAYALLHLVGGAVLSVLPLPIWPFVPAQTLYHYAFHALYGLAQLPLFVVALHLHPPEPLRSPP